MLVALRARPPSRSAFPALTHGSALHVLGEPSPITLSESYIDTYINSYVNVNSKLEVINHVNLNGMTSLVVDDGVVVCPRKVNVGLGFVLWCLWWYVSEEAGWVCRRRALPREGSSSWFCQLRFCALGCVYQVGPAV
jgi:hypothetical protein